MFNRGSVYNVDMKRVYEMSLRGTTVTWQSVKVRFILFIQ